MAYKASRSLGVERVPLVVINGRWASVGALGIDGYLDLLIKVVRRETAA